MKFDKFLKENDAKRARAIKKSAEEQELCKKKGISLIFMVPLPSTVHGTPLKLIFSRNGSSKIGRSSTTAGGRARKIE